MNALPVALLLALAGLTSACEATSSPTPLDQGSAPDDLAILGRVRRNLVADRAVSLRGKNVVVVVRSGIVTLRGDVASAAEHDAIVTIVASVPGTVRIDDHLVAPSSKPMEES